jgi:ATP-dependent RNA helicase DOB1
MQELLAAHRIPLLNPVKDMGTKEEDFYLLLQRQKSIFHHLTSHSLHKNKERESLCLLFRKKQALSSELKNEIEKFEVEISNSNANNSNLAKLASRIQVLQKLNFCTSLGCIETRGLASCLLTIRICLNISDCFLFCFLTVSVLTNYC